MSVADTPYRFFDREPFDEPDERLEPLLRDELLRDDPLLRAELLRDELPLLPRIDGLLLRLLRDDPKLREEDPLLREELPYDGLLELRDEP